ncbi:hypothetical protein ACSQ6I_04300 [Anabaena sp. WFMT]|uniref:hypothetical protein n=1 Tax=Anabaena sp. WFMT TaxID=3449730 RepID=UPI003F1F8BEE
MAWDHHNLRITVNLQDRTQKVDFNISCHLLTSISLLTFYLVVDAVSVTGKLWL